MKNIIEHEISQITKSILDDYGTGRNIDKMDLFSFFMSDSPSYDSLRLILAYISDATSPSTDIITAIAADFPNWNRLNA